MPRDFHLMRGYLRVVNVFFTGLYDAILLIAHFLQHLSLLCNELGARQALIFCQFDLAINALVLGLLVLAPRSLSALRRVHIVVFDLRTAFEDRSETLLVVSERQLILSFQPLKEIICLVASLFDCIEDAILLSLQRALHLVLDDLVMLCL